MKGLLWDRVKIKFIDPPKEGQEFVFAFEKHGKIETTDALSRVKRINKFRYAFSSPETDYTLEVTHV